MTDRILIDANSVGHAAHSGTVLKSGDQETQAVFGMIKTVRQLRMRHPNASMLVLWDGKSWRKEKSEVYKANREDDPIKIEIRRRYKTQTPYIRRALRLLGVPQLFALNLEADDLASILTKRFVAGGDMVRLVTGDQDWLQLVQRNVIWEDHREDTRKVNVASFKKWTGVAEPIQFVQLKALQGDVSDHLPGVGNIGEKRALELISIWGRVEAFLSDPDPAQTYSDKNSDKIGKKLLKPFKDFHANVDGRHEKFFHNMQLMNLIGDYIPAPQNMTLSKGEFDEEGFRGLCHELAFSSIYREGQFDTFIEPFKRTTH